MNAPARWESAVGLAIGRIKARHADGDGPAALAFTAGVLAELAERRDLFSLDDFAPPAPGGALSARYALHADPDQRFALYVNALLPGKTSVPHNHGTWAVIVAIEGEEINRIYHPADGADSPVKLAREFAVRPGQPALYGPEDIHSIHVQAERPALLFHLYGRALETLTDRLAFDLESGRSYPYNEKHYRPSVQPAP